MLYRIFTELCSTEFHHHLMNFSGATLIKLFTEDTQQQPSTSKLDIVISEITLKW